MEMSRQNQLRMPAARQPVRFPHAGDRARELPRILSRNAPQEPDHEAHRELQDELQRAKDARRPRLVKGRA